ncbi:hypothetical protein DWV00_13265 [Trinickia dinghuensis]|uniref:Uncharacterized protein n=2 Tax=Trinickia dinghuensis TaxID=2291023 RepID=A0A3D8JZM5_9BURK|nr:hypothetical protein DWV00_13265 [Trinickia dinghuensis]
MALSEAAFALHVHLRVRLPLHPPVRIPDPKSIVHAIVKEDHAIDQTLKGVVTVPDETVVTTGKRVAVVGKDVVVDGVKVTSVAGKDVAKVAVAVARKSLLGLDIEGKTLTAAAESARSSASQTLLDVRNGNFGQAIKDAENTVVSACAVASPDDVQDSSQLIADAREALGDSLSAVQSFRGGRLEAAALAMADGLKHSGNLISAVPGEEYVGTAVSRAGDALRLQAPYAKEIVADAKARNVRAIVDDTAAEYVEPAKAAITLARDSTASAAMGRFGEAALQAVAAVSLVAGQGSTGGTSTIDDAITEAQSALASLKSGDLVMASQHAADALSAAGNGLDGSDDGESQSLLAAAGVIKQSTVTVKQDTVELSTR